MKLVSVGTFAVLLSAAASLLQAQTTADLGVTKSGPATAAADTDVTYNVTVTNGGPDDATFVNVDDPIPAGMTFVSAQQLTGPTFTCSTPAAGDPGTVTCSISALTASTSASFSFVFHIAPATAPGTFFTNVVSVSNETVDPNSENDQAVATTQVPPLPTGDVAVNKNGPTAAAPGGDVTYTITITNGGPAAATNVALNDTLPGIMTFVSLTQNSGPTFSCTTPAVGAGGTITCSVASLSASTTATFTLVANVPGQTATGTDFTNTASVKADNDPNAENDSSSTTLTVSQADVSIVKSGPATANAGSNVSYIITIANAGPDAATDIVWNDALPPNTTFVSLTQDTGPAASCTTPSPGLNGSISCQLPLLGTGLSTQYTLIVAVGDTTAITNVATVSSASFDPDSSNNSSSVSSTITPIADVSVTKSGPATITAGTNATYTVNVSNAGPSTTTVTLTDVLPPNTTFVSSSTTPSFSCTAPAVGSNGTITCTIGPLAPAGTAMLQFTVHLASSAANGSIVTNTATVVSSAADPNPTNDASTVNSSVAAMADVSVVKSGAGTVAAAGTATYNITVANAGVSDAANVVLSDTIVAPATFASLTQNSGPTFNCTTGATITCSIASLPAATNATFTLVLNVDPAATGTLSNTATVSSTTSDPNLTNNSSTSTATITTSADLAVTKSGPATGTGDTDATYTLTVTNNGPATAVNVVLADALPANTTFVSEAQTSGPTFTCTTPAAGATGTVSCTIASLASGATAAFSIVVHLDPAANGAVINTATVTSATNDINLTNNSSSTTLTATASRDIPAIDPRALLVLAVCIAAVGAVAIRRG